MPNVLKNAKAQASIAGTTVLTAPAGSVLTVIGCRAANGDASANHVVEFDVSGTLISGAATPLPVGSAIDIMVGSKIVVVAGETVNATSDADSVVDVIISYLEQTP